MKKHTWMGWIGMLAATGAAACTDSTGVSTDAGVPVDASSGGAGGSAMGTGGAGASTTGTGGAATGGRTGAGGAAPDAAGGTQGCPPLPAFPDADCTGFRHTGVILGPYTGPATITAAGTVIDGRDIQVCLRIEADDVVIRRSRIRCPGGRESTTTYGVAAGEGIRGLVVEDTEISSAVVPDDCSIGDPPLLTRPMYLGPANGARLTRVHAHHTRSGINLGSGIVIEDSLLETNCNPDPHGGSGQDWQHSTAIGALGGTSHIVLRHNVLDNGARNASSSISFYPQNDFGGPNDDVTIEGNLIDAEAHYCAYLGYTPSEGERPNTRFVVTNNVWGTKYNADCGESAPVIYANFDLASFNEPYPGGWGGVWSGNTWRGGAPYELSEL